MTYERGNAQVWMYGGGPQWVLRPEPGLPTLRLAYRGYYPNRGRDPRRPAQLRQREPMSEQAVDSDVWMFHPDLGAITPPSLPSDYRMRFYGDRADPLGSACSCGA